MLMRGYTLFEESFYKDNKDLLEFIRIKRFYKNTGDDDEDDVKDKIKNKLPVVNNYTIESSNTNNVNNETEAMRNNKKFLPKIDSNLNIQNARSLRKRIYSPTYKLLCEVNEKFKTLGYRLSPPLFVPEKTRDKSIEVTEKSDNNENHKKVSSNDYKSPSLFEDRNNKNNSDNSNSNHNISNSSKKKLEIWMPNVLVEEIESENEDEIEHIDISNLKKKKTKNENNETIIEEVEPNQDTQENNNEGFHDKYEQNIFRSKPYLKNSNTKGTLNSKTIYKLINKQNTSDTEDLNSSSLDNKKFKENISPKPTSNPVLTKVYLTSKFASINSTNKQDLVKSENNETDNQKLKNNSKLILPPIVSSSLNSDTDTTANTISKIDLVPEYNNMSYRLARIAEPLSRTTKTLIDNELDEMLSNKKQLQQQYDEFRQKIIDLRSTDNSNMSSDIASTKMISNNKSEETKNNSKTNNSQLSSTYSAASSTATAAKFRYSKRLKESSFIKEQKISKLGVHTPESILKNKLDQNVLTSYMNRSQAFSEASLNRFNTETFIKLQQQQPRPLVRNPSFYSAHEPGQDQNFKKAVLSLHHPLKGFAKSQNYLNK
jgi:hypothetical protein